eukprot:m.52618 g.52618  ORF g.52618 m.52618 type:complete len:337 (+) comp7385_c0_seq3:857-1867(+)
MARMASTHDDWLAVVEQSADDVNASVGDDSTCGSDSGSGADTTLNPFLNNASSNNIPNNATDTDGGPQKTSPSSGSYTTPVTPKENVAPVRRKSRQLPTLNPSDKRMSTSRLRRSASLSFLPTSGEAAGPDRSSNGGGGGRRRRVLPDTSQGRLIKEMYEKLDEEARVRLEVVAELKEEKRRRWALEDAVQNEKSTVQKLQQMLEERRREVADLQREVDEERRARVDTELQAENQERETRRLKAELQRLREAQEHEATDVAHSEAALRDAWRATHEERRLRQAAETDLESIKRGILVMGGREVLEQILDSADRFTKGMTPSPVPMATSPVTKEFHW